MITRIAPSLAAPAPASAGSANKAANQAVNTLRSETAAVFSLELAAKPPAAAPPGAALSPATSPLKQLASDIDRQRQAIDRLLAGAEAGRSYSPAELLAWQARVYAYSQNMEVISSLVDKTLSAVKTTLNTQV